MSGCIPNFAVFLSGRGSNLEALIEGIEQNKIDAKLSFVLSNKKNALGICRAAEKHIPTYVTNREGEMLHLLREYKVDFVVLAGFLQTLSQEFLEVFQHPVINIHPSLLPKFGGKKMYGIYVHEAVIEAGEQYTGATTHFVTPKLDEGPILLQKKCKVETRDPKELSAQVLKLEHQLIVESVVKISEQIKEGKYEGTHIREQ